MLRASFIRPMYKFSFAIIRACWSGWKVHPKYPIQTEEVSHSIDQGDEESKDLVINVQVMRCQNVLDNAEDCKRD